MPDWSRFKQVLDRHAFVRQQPAATPWEGLLLGNADMGAIIFGPAHRLCFRLTKMDLWDARMHAGHYESPMPLSKFKEFVFKESKHLQHGQTVPDNLNDIWDDGGTNYPCKVFLTQGDALEGGFPGAGVSFRADLPDAHETAAASPGRCLRSDIFPQLVAGRFPD